jgi:ubiquinone/menaquinone biosynthesis C-methylase UbiE
MNHYQGKDRYKDPIVVKNYDQKRFRSLKGKLTDIREKACIEKALRIAKTNGPILDIPCGTGRITELLLRKGYKVTGADISPEMINYAKSRTFQYKDSVDFEIQDIEHLDFASNSYNMILTIRLLHHIPMSLHEKILKELHRVTRKWVIITFSNKYTIQNIKRNFISLFNKFPRYSISPEVFEKEAREAGFEIRLRLPLFLFFSESIFVLLEKQS